MSMCEKCLSYLFELYDSIVVSPHSDKRMPYSPQAVANWFIGTAKEEGVPIDQLKLMQLVYVAQGASLAEGRELIGEKLYAWKYGPVYSSLYNSLRGQGMEPITKYTSIDHCDSLAYELAPVFVDPMDKEALETLENVWKYLGMLSGVKLSSWSHTPDGPWYKAKKEGLSVIPNKYIKNYFTKLAKICFQGTKKAKAPIKGLCGLS